MKSVVGDKVVITSESEHLKNIFDTCVYEGKWLSRKSRVGESSAIKLHEWTVARIENEGKIHKCKCGKIARQFSRIMNEWVCAECWDLNVGEKV